MTIYVDSLVAYKHAAKSGARHVFGNGRQSCHMACDGNLDELHQFAARIGLKRAWFQNSSIPHYDLTPNRRAIAIAAGAVAITSQELIRHWRESQEAVAA